MFKRKLSSLDYGKDYNPHDETQFRQMVIWLEDMKIRLYSIDGRQSLRNIQNPQWEEALYKYLQDLKFSYDNDVIKDRVALSDWFIGMAVRFEYGDDVEKYKQIPSNKINNQQKPDSVNQSENPLEKIDYTSEEFKSGMLKLCELLQIPTKFNDTAAILRAVSKIITTKLSKEAIDKIQIKEQASGVDFSIEQMPLGFDAGDKIINEAAKILRLLYIQDLRTLQTKINETIVNVQSLVADPRTDKMSKPMNYDKWKKIEVSDDEDDTHPNIDTPSLFRWRHQARVERREHRIEEQQEHEKQSKELNERRKKLNEKLKALEEKGGDVSTLKAEKESLEKEERQWKEKDEDIKKQERLRPLDVDDLTHEGKSKTSINKKVTEERPKNMTEEEQAEYYKQFVEKHKDNIKKYGMFRHFEDTQKFLEEHYELVCEETANYLVIWCIDLEMEEKHSLMEHVSHQTMIMQFILELSKSLKIDPRQCVRPFFTRMKTADQQYKQGFSEELQAFRERVQTRAQQKVADAVKQYEEEERQKRLGPGGLDPVEVMESLPKELQDCFESRDIALLQETLSKMPRDEAANHLDRCIKSGLWVPNAKDAEGDEEEETKAEEQNEEKFTRDVQKLQVE
ncbi:unnamed protein product [Rotaria magnacalcarata]|uniref:Hsp90 chaperone protein kinase-targeting subunit n=1 Tax=Rotaria magnacalcarata TaxID=392030 RepID=A0A819GWA8_9BILA|nr:unnamed protein product [Rotaria magnacalcarata]